MRGQESRLKVREATLVVAFLLGKGVVLFDLAKPVFVAGNTEGIISNLFNERAVAICDDTGGAEMVLMIVTNTQGRVGDVDGRRSISFDINDLTRRKMAGQIVAKPQLA